MGDLDLWIIRVPESDLCSNGVDGLDNTVH